MDDETELMPAGREPSEPPPTFAGTARYRVERELGRGGMGQVFEVHDLERDTRCALKSLTVADGALLLRFKDEFRALRDIVHPNLVRLGELHEEGGRFFFTMELLRGTDFLRFVRPEAAVLHGAPSATPSSASPVLDMPTVARRTNSSGGRQKPSKLEEPASQGILVGGFDEHRLRAAFAQLAVGLAALHRAGKIHRDLKPSNIHVEPDGRVVILDFGVAAELDPHADRENVIVGTAHYMAPEQARGERAARAADWYAAGVVLYQALTGRLPHAAREVPKIITLKCENPAPPLLLGEHEEVRDLALLAERLVRRDPLERPSEDEVLDALGLGEGAAWLTPGALVEPGAADLVGREHELDELSCALGDARNRGPITVLVEAPSGMGKSSLVRAFAAHVTRADGTALVLRARCHEKESVRFKAFDGIVDGLARHLSARTRRSHAHKVSADDLTALCRLFPVMRTVPGMERLTRASDGGADPVEVRTRAFVALRALLRQLAESRPLVLTIDDLHWADADSLALLSALLRPPHAPRLLLVATRRPLEDDPLAAFALGEVQRLSLGPLMPAAGRALAVRVSVRDGFTLVGDVDAMIAESGGHPMFLEELVRQAGSGKARPGQRLEDAIAARLARLPGGVQRLLEVIAVAGSVSHGAATRVAELSPSGYAHAVEALRAERLVRITGLRRVDAIEPYHDRVRVAALSALDAAAARALHDRLAEVLLEEGADPGIIAEHLEQGSIPARAATHCLAAADDARMALAFERAAGLRRRALACGTFTETERVRLLEDIADDLSSGGYARQAADVLLEAEAAATLGEHVRIDLVRRAAELYLSSGHLELGVAAAKKALAHCGRSLPESRALGVAAFLWTDARVGLARFTVPKPGERAIDPRAALEADVLWSLGVGLALVDSVNAALLANQALLHTAARGDPQRMARCLCAAAALASTMGRFGRAERMRTAFDRALDVALDPTIRLYRQIADLAHSFLCENDWQRTLRTAYEARATWNLLGRKRGWEKSQLAQIECWALHQLGDVHALRTRVAENVREAQETGNRFLEVNFRSFFIDMALADDEPDAALSDVLAAMGMWRPVSGEFLNQDYLAIGSRTRIALYTGEVDGPGLDSEWARFDASLLTRVPLLLQDSLRLRGDLALLRARRARARGDTSAEKRELATVHAMTRRLGRVPLPLARLETYALRAGVAALERRDDEVVAALRAGLTAFRERSMALWTACLAHELGRRVGGDEGRQLLSEASQSFERHGIRNPAAMLRSCVAGLSELC